MNSVIMKFFDISDQFDRCPGVPSADMNLCYDDSPGSKGEKGEQGDNSGAEQHLSTSSQSE